MAKKRLKNGLRAVLRLLHSIPVVRRLLFRVFVQLHYLSYLAIKKFVILPGSDHPKQTLLNYQQFFIDNINATDYVLDVGCSTGNMVRAMAPYAAEVTGIEIEEEPLTRARRRNDNPQNVTFIIGDATTYTFNSSFDVITLSNVLEHIEDRDAFLARMNTLAPRLLVRVPLVTRDWLAYYLREHSYEYRLDPTHYTEYTEQEIEDELIRAGYRVQDSRVRFGEWYGVAKRNE